MPKYKQNLKQQDPARQERTSTDLELSSEIDGCGNEAGPF
jgi:hypothetical protein